MHEQSHVSGEFLLAGMLAGVIRGDIKSRVDLLLSGRYHDLSTHALGRILALLKKAQAALDACVGKGSFADIEAIVEILDAVDELVAGEVVH